MEGKGLLSIESVERTLRAGLLHAVGDNFQTASFQWMILWVLGHLA